MHKQDAVLLIIVGFLVAIAFLPGVDVFFRILLTGLLR